MLDLTLLSHMFGGTELLLVAPMYLLQQIGRTFSLYSMCRSSLLYLFAFWLIGDALLVFFASDLVSVQF